MTTWQVVFYAQESWCAKGFFENKASPYAGGKFRVELVLPLEFPMMPPQVRFITPVYH